MQLQTYVKTYFLSLPAFLFALHVQSAESNTDPGGISVDLAAGFSHFEQQVKTEVGGEKGDILVGDSELSFSLVGTHAFKKWFEAGIFTRLDFGNRRSGQFETFANGRPVIVNVNGGHFFEFWVGPLLRFKKKNWFAELGYAPLGIRKDTARSDLASTGGGTTGALQTSPSIAWLVALGSDFELSETLSLLFRVEYRVRYYNRRSGEKLADSMVHGTQSLLPLFGVRLKY